MLEAENKGSCERGNSATCAEHLSASSFCLVYSSNVQQGGGVAFVLASCTRQRLITKTRHLSPRRYSRSDNQKAHAESLLLRAAAQGAHRALTFSQHAE